MKGTLVRPNQEKVLILQLVITKEDGVDNTNTALKSINGNASTGR